MFPATNLTSLFFVRNRNVNMISTVFKSIINRSENCTKNVIPLLNIKRNGHTVRGKPPGVALTLEQRLKRENPIDEELAQKVNIGFPQLRPSRSQELKKRLEHLKSFRTNQDVEKKARHQELEVDLDNIRKDHLDTAGQYHLKRIAEHYGVFKDLFGDAFFVPRIPLSIEFDISNEEACPVYSGNVVKPSEAKTQPRVYFDPSIKLLGSGSEKDTYWSLVLTNPDGHFSGEEKEYVHWFISNIPGNQLEKADLIAPYIQPFPPRGLGYQRFIFVLYRQSKKLDFNQYKVTKLNDLDKRTFSTLDFYRKYQDDITPAGLAFFQSNWDESLTDFYYNVLEIKEPIFEYDFPKPYIKDQEWFPLGEPFNLYLDKYRDPKDVNKDYLKMKLDNTHPFEGPKEPLRFPNAHPIKGVPSWQKTEIKKNRLRWGRINDI